MKISNQMKETLTEEFKYALGKMRESKNIQEKNYFFSATYGAAHRILNIEYDDELLFMHNVLTAAYSSINQRIMAGSQGVDISIHIPGPMFSSIEESLEKMIDSINKGENTYDALMRISNAAYSTTGNGYYLYVKGILKI